jgi:hypothetical protein
LKSGEQGGKCGTFRNWCAHLHSSIDSPTLTPRHINLDWRGY